MKARLFPRLFVFAVVCVALLGTISRAFAWNSTGHMIVAVVAYDEMPPDVRAKWVEVLKHHPDFDKWEKGAPKDLPDFDFGRYLFMRAATWPDDIRKSGSPYDHPIWHYVDYPLIAPGFPLEQPPANTEDILSAIALSEKMIADPAATPVERAAYLAWLIHVVGDIQQPLHCVTMTDAAHPAPAGDHGGNLFFVSLAGYSVNLHSVWDGLPGVFVDLQEVTQHAASLETRFPRATLPELTQAPDPKAWSLEGRALAIDAVYRRGKLPGGYEASMSLPPLPAGYLASARALIERRLALGGWRLADALCRIKPVQ